MKQEPITDDIQVLEPKRGKPPMSASSHQQQQQKQQKPPAVEAKNYNSGTEDSATNG